MINRVILVGNLGKDPEVRHLESGSVVARFSVATNESYKDKNGEWQKVTEWHDIVAWRALAERVEKMLKKGNLVYIEGKLTHRKWQDKEGNDRYTTEVVANTVRLLEKKERPSGFDAMNTGAESTSAESKPSAVAEDGADDLPF